ncbi:Uncharacterized conserved protein [Marinobacter daqiaonensis]|uniref:Uncharacterized conserved protein n=1 Tax=Marinobacter daqiaonensis TaxID=650891 RepID=A0A1I6IA14_9GAMM|nr:exopolysaccharide biosynthesis protein [Marinobacter daqiaonensis]SFR63478.1 Uncharacterized conserved protein [Marinobacter daqiaonensis]
MGETQEKGLDSLEAVLDRLRRSRGNRDQVKVEDVLDAAGTRSFGPVVVLAGLVVLAPLIGDIPGVPTVMSLLIMLTIGQRLFRRERIWLPRWLSQRRMSRARFEKGLGWMYRPARFIDRFTGPRLTVLMTNGGNILLTSACLLVAMMLPVMELVPFSANGGGLALLAYGLAIIARDGLLGLIALAITAATIGFVVWQLA